MTKNQKKKAFGYIRVSTAMQVEGGYSLDDQENRIRQHAKADGMTLVDIYRDEGNKLWEFLLSFPAAVCQISPAHSL